MRPLIAPLIALTFSLVVTAAVAEPRDSASDRFHSSVEVSPGGRLEIRLDSGAGLEISTWDRGEIEVESTGPMSRCPDAELSLGRTDEGARLESRYAEGSGDSHECSMTLRVRLPKKFDISIDSSGGSIDVEDLRGRVDGQTGGGSIRLTRLVGSVRLSTGGGSIDVVDSDLDGRLSTGGGSVRFDRVTGEVVGTSGSMRHEVHGSPRER